MKLVDENVSKLWHRKPPQAFIERCFEYSDFELTQRMLKLHIFLILSLPFLRKKHECLLLALERFSLFLESYP